MKALVGGRGPVWVLDEVPDPEPGAGEVLIRTRAMATNNGDLPVLDAADPTAGGTGDDYVAGFEFAGEVVALGKGVDDWAVGDQVMGLGIGAFAELVVVDHRFLIERPAGLDPEIACALPTALITEHGALAAGGFAAGQRVLITGAASGIGLVGVQTAKALGAKQVIGTTRSAARKKLVEQAGADDVVVTGEQSLTEAVLAVTDGEGVDLALDHLGGQAFADVLPATVEYGHVMSVGRLAGGPSPINLDDLQPRNLTVHGVSFGFRRPEIMGRLIAGLLPEVMPAVERGEIRPVIDSVIPWSEPERIAARMRSGEMAGKIVLGQD